uniref:PPUP8181 n=1 Tax=Poeciliopsis prolifica TaxID=188132 RepID=A0A0S7EM38_9TELE
MQFKSGGSGRIRLCMNPPLIININGNQSEPEPQRPAALTTQTETPSIRLVALSPKQQENDLDPRLTAGRRNRWTDTDRTHRTDSEHVKTERHRAFLTLKCLFTDGFMSKNPPASTAANVLAS